MNADDVSALDGVELEYAFAEAMQLLALGTPNGPFALAPKDGRTLTIFGGGPESVEYSSFWTTSSDIPLLKGKELGASLYIKDGVAVCQLESITTHGDDYIEALMRALILHQNGKGKAAKPLS